MVLDLNTDAAGLSVSVAEPIAHEVNSTLASLVAALMVPGVVGVSCPQYPNEILLERIAASGLGWQALLCSSVDVDCGFSSIASVGKKLSTLRCESPSR